MNCPVCGSKMVFNVAGDTALKDAHKECFACHWYWQNNDTENQCEGQKEVCHEFIEIEVQDGKID